MKLSFSTNRWESCSFDDFIRIAREYKFNGIEIHNIDAPKLRSDFRPERLSGVQQKLRNHNLCISCLDLVNDIAAKPDEAFNELKRCLETARRLAKEEGLMCGISSGTNVAAALKLAKKLGPGKTVVTVLPDTAERYYSTQLFGE